MDTATGIGKVKDVPPMAAIISVVDRPKGDLAEGLVSLTRIVARQAIKPDYGKLGGW